MTETTILAEHIENLDHLSTSQVTESRAETRQPVTEVTQAAAATVEEKRTKAVRWFETETPQGKKTKTTAEVEAESKSVRWYEGYRAGYFC